MDKEWNGEELNNILREMRGVAKEDRIRKVKRGEDKVVNEMHKVIDEPRKEDVKELAEVIDEPRKEDVKELAGVIDEPRKEDVKELAGVIDEPRKEDVERKGKGEEVRRKTPNPTPIASETKAIVSEEKLRWISKLVSDKKDEVSTLNSCSIFLTLIVRMSNNLSTRNHYTSQC
jgi:hypothetical protein